MPCKTFCQPSDAVLPSRVTAKIARAVEEAVMASPCERSTLPGRGRLSLRRARLRRDRSSAGNPASVTFGVFSHNLYSIITKNSSATSQLTAEQREIVALIVNTVLDSVKAAGV